MLYAEDHVWKAVSLSKFEELLNEAKRIFGDDIAHINADSPSNNISILDSDFNGIGYIDIASEMVEDIRDLYTFYIERDGLNNDE